MSTAIFSPPIRRFAWKEYRTLRGLWVAMLILGMLADWMCSAILTPPIDFPALRLTVALAVAALYAAAAASILFSMEHEEQTYEFLRGLPATWQPVFAGKLALATVSALALAAALAFIGQWTVGVGLPSSENASLAFGIFGVAILEALAWGTFWSLLIKRPLAAAVVTLFVGSLAANIAVNLTASSNIASTDPRAYLNAIPLRLAIVVAVLGVSVLVARNWLAMPADASGLSLRRRLSLLFRWRPQASALRGRVAGYISQSRRSSMMLRLVWQTWRESWKLLVLPIVLAAVCLLIVVISGRLWPGQQSPDGALAMGTIFFGPALYGALAFAADQRRGHVRFLAEHAAAPRYVWLSRHVIWLGTLVVLIAALTIAGTIVLAGGLHHRWSEFQYEGSFYSPPRFLMRELVQFLEAVGAVAAFAWCGSLAAYSIGQLCSMVLRSEILATFLALVLATVLSSWIAVQFVWGLSPWLFVLPLAIGLMLATWLRAPGWIAGNNSLRAWLKPALAIIAPLAAISVLLPSARLLQISSAPDPWAGTGASAISSNPTALTQPQKSEAEATANMYLSAVNIVRTPITDDPLAPWSGPEFSGLNSEGPGAIDETLIPPDQMEAYLAAKKKLDDEFNKVRAAAIELAMKASERPTCTFTFHMSPEYWESNLRFRFRSGASWISAGKTYIDLMEVRAHLASATAEGREGDVPFDQLLAALRMGTHLRSGQPTALLVRELEQEQAILHHICTWNASKDRTNDERRVAIAKLQEYFKTPPDMAGALWADQALIRKIIEGQESPFIFNEKPVPISTKLAYLANDLPWERRRAIEALDVVTNQNLRTASDLSAYLTRSTTADSGPDSLRQWLLPDTDQAAWIGQQPQAVTSYLMSKEYVARVPVNEMFRRYCDTIAWQHATLLEIALAMYREDHKEYPAALANLTPEYLGHEPLDPYSMQPFHYQPKGLEEPLRDSTNPQAILVAAHTPLLWSVGPSNRQMRLEEPQAAYPVDANVPLGDAGSAPPGPGAGEMMSSTEVVSPDIQSVDASNRQSQLEEPQAADPVDADAPLRDAPTADAGPGAGEMMPGTEGASPDIEPAPILGSYYYFVPGLEGAWYAYDPVHLIYVLPK